MALQRCKKSRRRPGKFFVGLGAVLVTAQLAVPGQAQAGSLFDFLFGGLRQQPAAPVSSYAETPPGAVAPDAARGDAVIGGSTGGGRYVAYCVRLCDGQHFPLDHNANATPVETCRSMCPTAKTKVFFGTEIDHAVARDGARYADLDNAYVYREHFVSSCTCNGKDPYGLTRIDAKNDPTLRPGDIVTTTDGPMEFAGRRGAVAEFTPVDPAVLAASGGPTKLRLSQRAVDASAVAEPAAEEEPGVIVPRELSQPSAVAPPLADQAAR
jgi:hypothetical protein